jgi:hypothetical protein
MRPNETPREATSSAAGTSAVRVARVPVRTRCGGAGAVFKQSDDYEGKGVN